jgi:CelD/BcsL family acetyltransferase involved in cellulose biosynthesis
LPQWEDLLTEVPGATTFSTWEWLGSWWRAFGKGQLCVLGFYASSELVGLAPLCIIERDLGLGIRMKVLRFLGDGSGDSDNLDIVTKEGYQEPVLDSLLQYLDQAQARWHLVEFNTMPSDSIVGRSLTARLAFRGWTISVRNKPASAITLPKSWSSYLQNLASEDRNNLARYRKRLEKRYRVRFYKATEEPEVYRCLETMFELHQQRWRLRGEKGSFAVDERRRFYAEISRLFLARGWLELWALDVDQRTVAVQFAFRFRDQVFQLQEGFDANYSSDRVGMLLRGHVIEQLIAQGIKCYDFLGGEPGYKARWGAKTTRYIDLQFARSRSLGGVYITARKNALNGKALLRKKLPKSAWNILHELKVRTIGKDDPNKEYDSLNQ